MTMALSGGGGERDQLRHYAEAVAMWNRGFDTASIGKRLGVAEAIVARWVANFRDMMRGEHADA